MVKVGNAAPELALTGSKDSSLTIKALRGKKVVLYFYPKDMTPGCTQEACDFRDNMARLNGRGVIVIGVSSDSPASHTKFADKYDLKFELLSDPEFKLAKAYGAYGDKVLYGRKVTGIIRSTFLLDERGRVAALWSPVTVEGHVAQVLDAIRELDVGGHVSRPKPKTGGVSGGNGSRSKPTRSRRSAAAHP